MATYHTLLKPLRRAPDNVRVIWLTTCGIEVAMPPQKFSPGHTVQTPDKRGGEVIECAGCYAGQDQAEPEIGGDDSERLLAPGTELNEDDPFKPVAEERDEFPMPPTA